MRTEPSFSPESNDHLHAGLSETINPTQSESQLLSDYRQRYGLSIDPFVDDPHFPFYQGAQRRQILEQLLHLCQFSHNLLVVTGDYGVGKTRMAQALIDSLDDADDICFIEGQINSDVSSLLSEILSQFELQNKDEFTELCQKRSDQDGLVVLIIDNAHHLADDVIAGLINLLEEHIESRLHIVMFAEPHLLDRLNKVEAPDIVLTDFFLEKFSLADAVDYLNFRMEMADYLGPEIFIETKVEPWWRQSQGQLLALHDYAQQKLLESVSETRDAKIKKTNMLVPHIIATSALVGILFVGYLYLGDSEKESSERITEAVPVPAQQESLTVPASSLPQSSSSSTDDVAIANVPERISEQTQSLESQNASSATAEKVQSSQEIKQSLVPLAQTNDEPRRQSLQQSSNSVASVQVKEVKTTIPAPSKSKVATKSSISNSGDELQKANIYSAQEKTILSWGESEFTLQIVGLSSERSALEFISAQANKKDLLLFRSIRQGKDWYVVVSGRYPNSAQARQAISSLPSSQQKAVPWPRDLKAIHKELRSR